MVFPRPQKRYWIKSYFRGSFNTDADCVHVYNCDSGKEWVGWIVRGRQTVPWC